MLINEVFHSVQGEGVHQGLPTAFVRLQGCNLRCKWCDTLYAQNSLEGKELTPIQIRNEVVKLAPDADWVCITGGEPLSQGDKLETLIRLFHEREYKVEIETNGSFPIPDWRNLVDSWCVDVKCPASEVTSNHHKAWLTMREQDQVKFVVANETDLAFVESVLAAIDKPIHPTVLISPVINLIQTNPLGKEDYFMSGAWLQRCVEFTKEHNLRFSLQWHKVVWGNEKGV